MGDPELRSDEKVLVRTQGVYVKSIPFEGILTNKRIILIDRAKNLLPPKEIPLITVKEVEPGENAIRDQIITLSVMAKTGETRQMILTFSRQAGGNRIKERDQWTKIIRENASSSFDQVIRKVIPAPEPAPRKSEPAQAPRYEIVHSPVEPSPRSSRTSGDADGLSPVRRVNVAPPAQAAQPSPAARQPAPSPDTSVFCSKCGNRVPAESVFCNRCGSPMVRQAARSEPEPVAPAAVPVPVPQESTPAQLPVFPVIKSLSSRPIDDEIQSIEPLIERTTDKIPSDALRAPSDSPLKRAFPWDEEETPASSRTPEAPPAAEKPSGTDFSPQVFSTRSESASSAPSPSASIPPAGGADDSPPPPRPPRGRSILPGKKTIINVAIALVVILLIAGGAMVALPMLSGGPDNSGDGTTTPVTATTTRPITMGTVIPFEPTARPVPTTGVYVHINYLGGFEGSYGVPDALTTVPGNSGDRLWEIENATNSTVQAKFTKQDGSPRELLVEIYKDGRLLTGGSTNVGHGSVALSVDMATGIAAEPVTSGRSSAPASAASATQKPTAG